MKRLLLSGFIIISFVIYSLSQRNKGVSGLANGNPGSTLGMSSSGGNITSGLANYNYKDGQFVGDVTDAYYGNVQVQVTINGGKITNVQFLDYPQDRRTSQEINSQAMPYLKSEAITTQSANVDVVSGATATSQAFIQSLTSALAKAK